MTTTRNDYFSIERDMEIINADGFFCRACLVGKPAAEQSPDARYCKNCYDFLLQEARLLTGHTKTPNWIPNEVSPVSQHGGEIVLPSEDTEIPRYHNSTDSGRRGPKQKPLPEVRIRGLSSAGLGVKAIAKELKGEGVLISAQTVSRLLSGKRRQVELPGT